MFIIFSIGILCLLALILVFSATLCSISKLSDAKAEEVMSNLQTPRTANVTASEA